MTGQPPPAEGGDAAAGQRLTRRGLLLSGTAGLGLGLLAGVGAGVTAGTRSGGDTAGGPTSAPPRDSGTNDSGTNDTGTNGAGTNDTDIDAIGEPVPSRGVHQAGIARPQTPQRHAFVLIADLDGDLDAARALAAVEAAGEAVDACTDPARADPLVLPDGVGDLSITIGIGPRLVQAIDPSLPGASPLPAFAGDTALSAQLDGGDLLIAVYSSDAAVLHAVAESALGAVPGARRRWAQQGFRGQGSGTIVRNPLGYHDGVIVPRSHDELADNVWIASGPAAGGTVAVVRRLRLDVASFHAQPVDAQDRVIGRTRLDGAPLSGGTLGDEANLAAKSPEGEYAIPPHAHVRAAHPSFTGSALMLRRGYAFSNAAPPGAPADDGLLFLCFQNDLEVFSRTQHRLDETDDLMSYVTTTASASFLVLPGRAGDAPLGFGLR